jgi:pimeloyl-ACP methyl ester carboxylesterase
MTPSEISELLNRYETESVPGVVTTPRYRCRYRVWGTGPPVVFIHGLTDRAKSFVFPMARLAERFTVVGFELADGETDGAVLGSYRHRHHAEDLVHLLDHLGFDRVDLLGSSYGSTIAIRTMGTYPDRVRRCVLQGGFARRPIRWFERGPARMTRFWPGRIGDVPGRSLVLARLDGPQFAAAPPIIYDLFLTLSGSTPIEALTRRTLLLDKTDLRTWLPDVRHPVLLIGGNDDRIVPRWCEAELESGLRDVHRVEIDGCGHYPQYTHPERMAEAMRSFLFA